MTDARTIDARLTEIIGELLDANIPMALAMEQVEIKFIAVALRRTKRHKAKAATLLGIHRNTLFNKLRMLR